MPVFVIKSIVLYTLLISIGLICFIGISCKTRDHNQIVGERALAEGNQLRASIEVNSRRKAIDKYQESLYYWRILGDKRRSSHTLKLIGDLYQEFGEFQESPCYYDLALQYNQQVNDPSLEIEIYNGLSYAHIHLGNNTEAKVFNTKALDLSHKINDRRGEAQALSNYGDIYYALGDRHSALDYYQKALSLWEVTGDRYGQAQGLLYVGYVYSDLSESQKAFDYYHQSLRLWESINDHRGRALTLVAIAHLHSKLGEKQVALNLYDQLLPLVKALGDQYWEASVLFGMGFVYESLGESRIALNYDNEARKIYRKLGLQREEAEASIVAGEAYYSVGDYYQALAYFNEVLLTSQRLGDKKLESHILKNMGAIHNSLGEKKKALIYLQKALAIYQDIGTKGGEISTLNSIGNIYRDAGQKMRALGYFNKALSVSELSGNLNGQVQTHFNIARTGSSKGDLSAARSHIEQTINIAESLRDKIGIQELRASYFASIQQHFRLYVDVLMRQHDQHPSEKFNALGFEQSERARARSLLEQLTEARADFLRWGDPALIDRLRDIQQKINAKAEYKTQRINAGAKADDVITISKELTSLIIERDQVEAQIRAQKPNDPTLAQLQPSTVNEIQGLLDDNTVLLEYTLDNQRSYLWVVTPKDLKSHVLPSRALIEKAAESVYQVISKMNSEHGQARRKDEEAYWRKASILSKLILAPVADQLGNKRLLVVPDGALQYIPFQALPQPRAATSSKKPTHDKTKTDDTELKPLIIDHEIINLPSASTLAVLRRETAQRNPAPKTIAVFANPVFQGDDLRVLRATGKLKDTSNVQIASNRTPSDTRSLSTDHRASRLRDGIGYPPLYSTQDEANAIIAVTNPQQRQVWMDFDANRVNALSPELNQYRIIHFATHGDLDNDNPELSAIVLSFYDKKGQRQEGFLRLHDIYNLKLSADLVVLSACQTALGKEIKGEGLIGLTRGFMYAGAARVMASLWKVEDESTAELMKHFYRFLLKDKLTPAASLRQAQIELWKNPNLRAPYHWAGFVLQGEWK